MTARFVAWLAIILNALALVPGGAHFFALSNKMKLADEDYFISQNAYRGWAFNPMSEAKLRQTQWRSDTHVHFPAAELKEAHEQERNMRTHEDRVGLRAFYGIIKKVESGTKPVCFTCCGEISTTEGIGACIVLCDRDVRDLQNDVDYAVAVRNTYTSQISRQC
jgi:hypothetical protein